MASGKIENLVWYTDKNAVERDEVGIRHSFMAALATALNHIDGHIDPVGLMGGSGFAFRIFVNETMCPSAMSIFDWMGILPEVVEQAEHDCYYASRLWDEEKIEAERRQQAHELIMTAIGNGIPAVVWDIADAEWGLISGYDDDRGQYNTMTWTGTPANLPYTRLGKNGIDILSVTVPGGPNGRGRDEIIYNALTTAVNHAEQKEWTDRPKYQNGLAAYDMWATIYDRWAMLVEAGKTDNIGADLDHFARYYSSHYYSARCYARDFIKSIALDNQALNQAANAYARVAENLKPVWQQSPRDKAPNIDLLGQLAKHIRQAKVDEDEAIGHIKQFLTRKDDSGRASLSME